jgi:hypothetical protein
MSAGTWLQSMCMEMTLTDGGNYNIGWHWEGFCPHFWSRSSRKVRSSEPCKVWRRRKTDVYFDPWPQLSGACVLQATEFGARQAPTCQNVPSSREPKPEADFPATTLQFECDSLAGEGILGSSFSRWSLHEALRTEMLVWPYSTRHVVMWYNS